MTEQPTCPECSTPIDGHRFVVDPPKMSFEPCGHGTSGQPAVELRTRILEWQQQQQA